MTVCDKAREECPVFPEEAQRLHGPFEDPASFIEVGEERLEALRKLRDRVHGRVIVFLGERTHAAKNGDSFIASREH